MHSDRPPKATNSGVQKRKWESKSQHGPPAKKARQDHGQFQVSYSTSTNTPLPDPMPELPPISEELQQYVFTHAGSTARVQSSYEPVNYERLEFLGDAYIEIISSRLIFESYQTANAGEMSRLRESVVKNETLSKYAVLYGFDKKLVYPEQDVLTASNKSYLKIYGDVFEAYAAAVVLSDPAGGQARLETWLKALWTPILKQTQVQIPKHNLRAKEELSTKVVCPGVKLNYVDERKPILHIGKGKETYFIGIYLDGWGWKNQHLGSGEGSSKVAAGQEAATNALNNHPLIDEIISKKQAFLAIRASAQERKSGEEAAKKD